MTDFKIGDRVRVNEHVEGEDMEPFVGVTGVVDERNPISQALFGQVAVTFNTPVGTHYGTVEHLVFLPSELELIES